MSDTVDPRFHDARLAQRAIRRGQLSAKAYEKHVKSAPDAAAQAVPIEAEMEAIEIEADKVKGRKSGVKGDDWE